MCRARSHEQRRNRVLIHLSQLQTYTYIRHSSEVVSPTLSKDICILQYLAREIDGEKLEENEE